MQPMKVCLTVFLVLLLAACSQQPSIVSVDNPAAVWKAHANYLYNLNVWQSEMSVLGVTSEEKFKTRLSWNQDQANYTIKLRDFIGRTVALIDGSASQVSVKTSKCQTYQGDTAEQLLDEVAGMRIPLEGLKYWLRGIPEPGIELDAFTLGEDGAAKSMSQNGWRMSYPLYRTYGDIRLPQKVLLEYDDLNLTVNITHWDLIR